MYACNGILFKPRKPRAWQTFVTSQDQPWPWRGSLPALDHALFMAILRPLRDWGHARLRWRCSAMRSRTPRRKYVIATAARRGVRRFIS